MFRSLRARLTLSHLLPLLLILPLLDGVLIYVLENHFLAPVLSRDMVGQARLLAEAVSPDAIQNRDEGLFQVVVTRARLDPDLRVMFFNPQGELVYTNDQRYQSGTHDAASFPGFEQALSGQEVVFTNLSLVPAGQDPLQVLSPAFSVDQQVVGVVRLTRADDLFWQIRGLTTLVILVCLALGLALGLILARSIGNPVANVTQALYSMARGDQEELLPEQGPKEVRELVGGINYLITRLRELEQARRQLLANLVHELGRPLGALRSAIQALDGGAAEDPRLLSELTSGMDQEAARLQNIVEDLTHLHDQVLGYLELQRQEVQLSEWLAATLPPWRQSAVEKGIYWETQIPDDLPVVQIDPLRFGQALGNLLHNAIRYTPPGEQVRVEAGTEGDVAWIEVRDRGPGIPFEEQEQVFQPFYRGEHGRRFPQGMGLGLSIARDLVAAHGGRLELQSTPGEGSRFTVWLPL